MGLRQRLALGCALVHRPQALFLDAPTSGVDPLGRRRVWDLLFALARRDGVGISITTHHMSEAQHCDRAVLMFAGRLVADAAPADLTASVAREAGYVLELAVDDPVRAVAQLTAQGDRGAPRAPSANALARSRGRRAVASRACSPRWGSPSTGGIAAAQLLYQLPHPRRGGSR
jgi:ABC-type multidrug transport system ATPase subunit